MAASQSGFDAEEYKNALDQMLTSVMPSTWHGHARVKIAERGFEEDRKHEFAESLSRRLMEKHPNLDAEIAAEKCIESAEEKFE